MSNSSTEFQPAFVSREVGIAFVFVLSGLFLPPLLFDGQLLHSTAGQPVFYSPAAPIFSFSVQSASALGCGSLSCIPLILGVFVVSIYSISVALANTYRLFTHLVRTQRQE